jgi:hypothetical protein
MFQPPLPHHHHHHFPSAFAPVPLPLHQPPLFPLPPVTASLSSTATAAVVPSITAVPPSAAIPSAVSTVPPSTVTVPPSAATPQSASLQSAPSAAAVTASISESAPIKSMHVFGSWQRQEIDEFMRSDSTHDNAYLASLIPFKSFLSSYISFLQFLHVLYFFLILVFISSHFLSCCCFIWCYFQLPNCLGFFYSKR